MGDATPHAAVLIVDDRPENLIAVEAILEPLGQRLVRATSGEEALRRLLQEDFAVILLDVQMPGMNGFETARIIKSRERTKFIPIIFLTAISKEEAYVFQGYSVGAVDYMAKPFQPDILRSKVSVFIDLWQKQHQIARQEQRLRESDKQALELKHVRELLASEARLGEIIGSAMDAIVTFDEMGTVTLFNAAAQRIFGVTAAAAVGSPVTRLFAGDPVPLLDQLRKVATRMQGAPHEGGIRARPESLTGRRRGGEPFPVEASVSCMSIDAKPVYTLIARDVSERVRADEALRAQAEELAATSTELRSVNNELHQRQAELERAMSARSRFYASMSHELRTPINAILGYSTLLLEGIYGALNEKQAEGIRRTHKAAKHLLELVNDVLDLSKIEAGKIDLKLQPVSFPEIIEDLFVTVRPLADEHGSTLSLDHRGEIRRVITDPRRVRQILLNLLSNAIKFGRGKPISVVSTPLDEGGIAVDVTDEGPGIAAEDQARIFDEFVQLGRTQHAEGTGLGLPISRRLALLLRGNLDVTSTVGIGSTFRLVLPASSEAPPAASGDRDASRAVHTEAAAPRPSSSEAAERPRLEGSLP